MADWKKIIVSGSSPHFSNITASNIIKGETVTSSNLAPLLHFNGNRQISNFDLPIYQQNFGTTGDLKDFIEAVFFSNVSPEIPPSQSYQIEEWTTGLTSLSPKVAATDQDIGVVANESLTYSVPTNDFFQITTNGTIQIKEGVTVNKGLNTHPSQSGGETLLTFPLEVTVTDTIGGSDTEIVYIRINPNEKPVLTTHAGGALPFASNNGELNEYNEPKVIYEFTRDILDESSGTGFKGSYIKYSDVNPNDTFKIVNATLLDSNGINLGDQVDNPNTKFSVDIHPTVSSHKIIRLEQLTSSLDFETNPRYTLFITASDNHFPSPDTSSVVYIKYNIPVSDNIPPGIPSPQDFQINENSPGGTIVTNSPITITGPEVFSDNTALMLIDNFQLLAATETLQSGEDYMLQPYNITNSLASTNSSLLNPSRDPFQVNVTGDISLKDGHFLNADIARYYYYSASVTDIYNINQSSSAGVMRIDIIDDSFSGPTFLNRSDINYIIESATQSGAIKNRIIQESHGDDQLGSSDTTFNSTDNLNVEINSYYMNNSFVNVELPDFIHGIVISGPNPGTVGRQITGSDFRLIPSFDLSGSIYTSDYMNEVALFGGYIDVQITASKTSFPTTKHIDQFFLKISPNQGPAINTSVSSEVTSFNLAVEEATLYTLTFNDPENNAINYESFTLTGPQESTLTQLSSSNNGSSLLINCRNHLSASTTYNFTASIGDIHGFRTSSISRSFSIGNKNTGVFQQTPGTYYLIESATDGASVVADPSGRTGTPVQFSVDYSGGDTTGDPVVQSFTASVVGTYDSLYPGLRNMLSISSGSIPEESGLLTVSGNISGSNFNLEGSEFDNIALVFKVFYQDQYGNFGESNFINILPVDNLAPVIVDDGVDYSSNYFDYIVSEGSVTLKGYTYSDPEGDTINNGTAITSSDTSNGLVAINNAGNLTIRNNEALSVGAYNFTASLYDIHNFRTSSVSGTINIAKNTVGTLTANTTTTHNGNGGSNKFKFFIEEDGRNGNIIHTEKGENNSVGKGVQADLDVNYGSTGLGIQAFAITSTQVDINITSPGGLLTLGEDVSGSFTPTQISNGTAIITASVLFTDNSPSNNQNSEIIYIEVFPNASLGTLTANTASNDDQHNNKALFYIEEYGVKGNAIHTEISESNRAGNGVTGSLGGLYLNHQNESSGLSAANFETSSNTTPHINLSPDGKLTLGENISGSVSDGTIITVPISFTDNLSNNIRIHDTIYVRVFANGSLGVLTDNTSLSFNGNLGNGPKFFIEECGVIDNAIHTITGETSRRGNGLTGSLGVNYNNASGVDTGLNFASFTSSNPSMSIDNSTGNITLAKNISGSFTSAQIAGGSAILSSSVTFVDDGPVGGSGSLTSPIYIEVFQNASLGTLTDNTSFEHNPGSGAKPRFFVQEYAKDGDKIHNLSGITNNLENGNQANLGVDYSPTGLNVANFSVVNSSPVDVDIDGIGRLSIGEDLNGSLSPGAIITVNISFTDDGPSSLTLFDTVYVQVFANASLGVLTANTASNDDGVGTHLGKPLFYIQEYAIDGDHIHTEERIVAGIPNGVQAQLTGSFGNTGLTPINYAITSTTDGIDVDIHPTTGKLTIGENISGSVTNGQFIGVSASFQDNNSDVTILGNFYIKVFDNGSRGILNGNNDNVSGGDELYYIQEAAKLGDEITINTGFTDGNETHAQGDLAAIYLNPNGTNIGLAGTNFRTSSHSTPKVTVSSTGLLTIGEDISGSVAVNDLITVPIAYTDNGPSGGSGSIHDTIKVKVFANDAPNYVPASETFVDGQNPDVSGTMSLPLVAGTVIRTFRITDNEHDFPYTASLGGTNANKFYIDSGSSAANNESTNYQVKVLNTLINDISNQVLSYKIIMKDNVGKTTETSTIETNFTQAPNKVFAYSFRTVINKQDNAQAWIGGVDFFGNSNSDYLDPDAITNVLTGSVLAHFQSGSLGNSFVPVYAYQGNSGGLTAGAASSCVLINSANLTQLKGSSGIKSLGTITSDSNKHLVLYIFPSSSTLNHKPRDIDGSHNYVGGDTADSLRKYSLRNASSPFGPVQGEVIYFNTSESYFGYNTWGMIHTKAKNYTSELTYELINTPQLTE